MMSGLLRSVAKTSGVATRDQGQDGQTYGNVDETSYLLWDPIGHGLALIMQDV